MFCKIVQNEIPLFNLRKTARNTNLEENQFAAYHFIDSEYKFGKEILINLFSVYHFIASEYHFAKEILLNLIRCDPYQKRLNNWQIL